MDYLKALHENPDLAEEFDSLFDFFLLDELSPRDEADGRATFTLPGMAFARDGSGGEYHLLEDGSIGYYSSEGEAGRLAESISYPPPAVQIHIFQVDVALPLSVFLQCFGVRILLCVTTVVPADTAHNQ